MSKVKFIRKIRFVFGMVKDNALNEEVFARKRDRKRDKRNKTTLEQLRLNGENVYDTHTHYFGSGKRTK